MNNTAPTGIDTEEQDRLLDAATRIGRRLARDAFWHDGRCNWMAWSNEAVAGVGKDIWRTLEPNFYEGLAGIALFLARLARAIDDPVVRRTAQGSLAQLRMLSLREREPGFYLGADGAGFTLLEAGDLLERSDFMNAGLHILSQDRPSTSPDILTGLAGQIQGLLAAAPLDSSGLFLERATQYGDRLVAAAQPAGDGLSWVTPVIGVALGGYSHGTAGIACALSELASATGESRFLDASLRALAFDRSLFDEEAGNWRDMRTRSAPGDHGRSHYATTWCNGTSGIGLGRIRMLRLIPAEAERMRQEINAAVNATLQGLPMLAKDNYSLCHGVCGGLEFLAEAATALQQPDLLREAVRQALEAADRIEFAHDAWLCGGMSKAESPSLMLGLAGIGHFYLRLAMPEKIPSILLIQPSGSSVAHH